MSTVNEMDPKIIDGKRISKEIKEEIRDKVSKLNREGKEVALAVILVGENPAPPRSGLSGCFPAPPP